MEKEIIAYIKRIEEANRAEEKLNTELRVASKIQLEALPKELLEEDRIRIDSFIQSAKEVGGDFYDYFYLDNDRIAITISDVSGKGIPAALFMMRSKELIKSKLLSGIGLEQAFYEINNELLINNDEGLFITSIVLVINLKTYECKLINAGHEKPILVRDGNVNRINVESNLILGSIDNFEYKEEEFSFKAGDKLLLHTDGLNESINDDREEFGYDRIMETLKNGSNYIEDLKKALDEFTGDKEQFDDVTIISINLKDKNSLVVRTDKPSMDFIDELTNKFKDHFTSIDQDIKNKVAIIIDELINNYISYEDLNTLFIEARFNVKDNKLFMEFINNGEDFNPLTIKENSYTEYSDDIVPGGLGILIVKEITNDVKYERVDGLNKLSISIDLGKKKEL